MPWGHYWHASRNIKARATASFRQEVRGASIFQWNARGLKPRISDIRQFVFNNPFPIPVICEQNLPTAIRLSGYEGIESSTGGASSKVMVFIRRELTYTVHSIRPHDTNQYVCLTVKKRQLSFTLLGAYISPSPILDRQRLKHIFETTPGPWILTGDFNAHHPLWGSSKMNLRGRRLASFASEYGLCVLNDGSPTFLRGPTYASCLDLTLASRHSQDISNGLRTLKPAAVITF